LFISNHEGIEAIAFAAQDVPDGYSLRTLLREYLARPNTLLDVYVQRPAIEKGNWERSRRPTITTPATQEEPETPAD
jgi:SanA protein